MRFLILTVVLICLTHGDAFSVGRTGGALTRSRSSSSGVGVVVPFLASGMPRHTMRETPCHSHSSMRLNAGWGNYKSDGKREGTILFVIVLLAVVRGAFIPKDLRTTTTCPTGFGAERTLARFQENDSSYHCLPTGELVYKYFTSRFVFPGDPEFDPNFLRIEMRGVKQGGVSFSGETVD